MGDMDVHVLAMAGSFRKESFNRKLLHAGVEALRKLGATVDVVDLNDFDIPVYSQDIEDVGVPPGVEALKQRIAQADGLLFAVPEYNSSVPGGFKNVLDWASRGTDDPLRGKVGAIMSASPSGFGGVRMNSHLRQIMRALGVLTLHEQVTLSKAHEAFHDDGSLVSKHVKNLVDELAQALVNEVRLRKLGARQLRVTLLPETIVPAEQAAEAPKGRR